MLDYDVQQFFRCHQELSIQEHTLLALKTWLNNVIVVHKCAIHHPKQHWEAPSKQWSRLHIDYAGPFERQMF
jgi:hypothetical protein